MRIKNAHAMMVFPAYFQSLCNIFLPNMEVYDNANLLSKQWVFSVYFRANETVQAVALSS